LASLHPQDTNPAFDPLLDVVGLFLHRQAIDLPAGVTLNEQDCAEKQPRGCCNQIKPNRRSSPAAPALTAAVEKKECRKNVDRIQQRLKPSAPSQNKDRRATE
jgi:hypothetical protein